MPLTGSESESVESLEWAVEEMSFLLCKMLVRLQYSPQPSYTIIQLLQRVPARLAIVSIKLLLNVSKTCTIKKSVVKQWRIKFQVFYF